VREKGRSTISSSRCRGIPEGKGKGGRRESLRLLRAAGGKKKGDCGVFLLHRRTGGARGKSPLFLEKKGRGALSASANRGLYSGGEGREAGKRGQPTRRASKAIEKKIHLATIDQYSLGRIL